MEPTTIEKKAKLATKKSLSRKEQVVALLNAIESGDTTPMAYIDATHFKQHNLTASDGVEGFGEMLSSLAHYHEAPKVNCIRVIEDGDYVAAHSEYNLFGEKIGFDVFRYEDDKIVEHWDNLQPKPTQTNPSGHTMIDGTSRICNEKETESNRALIQRFVSEVLIGGNTSRLATYFDGDSYRQHNPMVGDGVKSFAAAMAKMAKDGVTMTFTRLHKVIAEGNFVLAISEGKFGEKGGTPTAYYDLFRIHNNKVAEHWDVIESITAKKDQKNNNGKFGF